MARTENKLHFWKTRFEISVGNVDAWARAPVTKQARFDVGKIERAIQKEVVLQKDLRNRKIIAKADALANRFCVDAQPMYHMAQL